MDAARNKTSGSPYGYEARQFQPTVSTSSQSSIPSIVPSYISPTIETREDKNQMSNPPRPKHIGMYIIYACIFSTILPKSFNICSNIPGIS